MCESGRSVMAKASSYLARHRFMVYGRGGTGLERWIPQGGGAMSAQAGLRQGRCIGRHPWAFSVAEIGDGGGGSGAGRWLTHQLQPCSLGARGWVFAGPRSARIK